MVDSINRVSPGEVAFSDAIDEDGGGGEGTPEDLEEELEEDGDGFEEDDHSWQKLNDRSYNQRPGLNIDVSSIKKAVFFQLLLNRKPPVIFVAVTLENGQSYDRLGLVLSRELAMQFSAYEIGQEIDLKKLAAGQETLNFIMFPAGTSSKGGDTSETRELTLSQTVRMFFKRTWAHRLGLKDAKTNRNNTEIIAAYTVLALVVLGFAFGLYLVFS
jgi:hypothetical protein